MYEIIPYVGVGEIRLGMHCDEVLGLLHEDHRRIDNTYTAGYKLCTRNLNLHFDENDRLLAIEGDTGFCYQGFEFVGQPFHKAYKYLKKFDPETEMDSVGATSYQLGIGLYVPTLKKSKKEPVEGVILFQKGYYGEREPE